MIFKVGVIGCGNIASLYSSYFSQWAVTHLAAYSEHPLTEVVSVCDLDLDRARSCAELWKIPKYYTNYKEMLQEEKCDIISVCTNYEYHAEIIREIVKHNVKAVICEKPFTNNLDEAKELIELCNQKKVLLAVNFQRRHDQLHHYVKENLSQLVGDVKKVIFLYTGGIINNGSHAFDILRFYFGDIASLNSIVDEEKQDPNLTVHIRFKSGLLAVITSCSISNHSIFEMSILGSKARLDLLNKPFWGYDYRYIPHIISETLPTVTCSSSTIEKPLPKDIPRDLFFRAIDDLIKNIGDDNKKDRLVSSAENGLSSLELVSAALASARTRKEVLLPYTKSFILPRLDGVFTTWKKN